jgi:putative membrane-bound dehydrogenase-like protein
VTICRLMLVLFACRLLFSQAASSALPAPATNAPAVATNSAPTKVDQSADLSKSFQVKRGFRLELVASEPLVADPVAMAFDENGRLFVVESRARGERGPGSTGRVRVLEDNDGDGHFDASSIYADNLKQPAAVVCYGGGVFVACGSEILFLKDTQGDDVADVRRVVFTGYGDASRGAPAPAFTALAWGLDNLIHVGATGPGEVAPNDSQKSAVALSEGNFAFDPRTLVPFAESGVAPTGMCFDDRGREFVCSSGDHIVLVMYEARYAARNPYLDMPGALLDVAARGAATTIYSLRPRPMASGFSAATGLTIYRGQSYPADYWGDAFVADAAAGIVHHEKLRPQGIEMVADKAPDETGSEFLAGRDGSFQPMRVINGPDGALYIADQTSGAVEPSVPAVGRTNAAGKTVSGHGRIYRIVSANFQQPKPPRLGKAAAPALVAMLMQANGWYRDTASRLLYERQGKEAINLLIRLFLDRRSTPLARVHALHLLDGMHTLVEPHVLSGLIDPDERVREHAVRLAERVLPTNGVASYLMWQQLSAMGADPSIQVRYQLAFTLGQIHNPGRVQLLADILRRDAGSRWMQAAVLSSLDEGAGEMFSLLAPDRGFRATEVGEAILDQLLVMVGAKNQPDDLAFVFNTFSSLPDTPRTFKLTRVLADGLQRAGSSLMAADARGTLKALYARAARLASEYSAPDEARVEAVLLLGCTSYAESGYALLSLLNLPLTPAVQDAVIAALSHFAEPNIAPLLVQRWPLLIPAGRAESVVAMLARPERTRVLLAALEGRLIGRAELGSTQVRFLLAHPDPSVRQRAQALFGNGNDPRREAIINQFLPAAQMPGNGVRGQGVFAARCAACHQLGGGGSLAGVDLSAAARGSRQETLAKILDPDRDVDPNHPNVLIETSDGETLTGFISAQTAASITLCQATGSIRLIPRARIQSQQNLAGSAMPEGLEAGLDQQGMADLLEYLAGVGAQR